MNKIGCMFPRPVLMQYPCDKWDCEYCSKRKKARLISKIMDRVPLWRSLRIDFSPSVSDPSAVWQGFKHIRKSINPVRMWGFIEKANRWHGHSILCCNDWPQDLTPVGSQVVGKMNLTLSLECGIVWVQLLSTFSEVCYVTKYVTKQTGHHNLKNHYFQYTRPGLAVIEDKIQIHGRGYDYEHESEYGEHDGSSQDWNF